MQANKMSKLIKKQITEEKEPAKRKKKGKGREKEYERGVHTKNEKYISLVS